MVVEGPGPYAVKATGDIILQVPWHVIGRSVARPDRWIVETASSGVCELVDDYGRGDCFELTGKWPATE